MERAKQQYRQIREILAVREVLHLEAQHMTGLARDDVADRDRELDASSAQLETAVGEWMDYLAEPGLDPVRIQGLQEQMIVRDDARARARERLDTAETALTRRETEQSHKHAEVEAVTSLHGLQKRRLLRRREERWLTSQEDRVAYQWRRS